MRKIKGILQKLRLILGRIIFDKFIKINLNNINKILFLRQDGKIGDYIVSSFVFRELKKWNPSIQIGVVCTTKNAYLFEQNKHIDRLYFIKKKNIVDYIKQGRLLAKEEYDVVIDPTVVIRNRDLLLLRLISAKNYIGYRKDNYHLFNHNIVGDYHFSEIYKIALEKLGLQNINTEYDVPYDEKSAVEIERFLTRHQAHDFIAINFYGAGSKRRISDENITHYLDYLTRLNHDIILLTYSDVTKKLKNIAKNYNRVFVHDTVTIFETIELIRKSRLLISPDTSTVHIASGLNKPIIALYSEGAENFTQWKPTSKAETHILFYKENINEIQPEEIKAEWLEKK